MNIDLDKIPKGNYARDFYELNYDFISFFILNSKEQVYLGPDKNRVCRFCRGIENVNVTFKNTAHAIPELLGNKILESGYECDNCNGHFGRTIEHQLGAYTKAYRGITAIAGKRRIPKLGSKEEGWSIASTENGINVVYDEKDEVIKLDRENKTISMRVRRDPYLPIDVYKALVKIAIAIAPESETALLSEAAHWVRYGALIDPSPCNISMTFVSGWRPMKCLAVALLKIKYEKRRLPHYMFSISFANVNLQIAIPCPKKDGHLYGDKITFPPFPTPFEYGFDNYPVSYRTLDMSGTEKVCDDYEELHAVFDSVNEIEWDSRK